MIEFFKFMKILHIVGARPQFIKAAMVSKAWNQSGEEAILHTGQHYDENMSRLFFDELGLPEPDINLGVGGGSHAEQTSRMLTGIDDILKLKSRLGHHLWGYKFNPGWRTMRRQTTD